MHRYGNRPEVQRELANPANDFVAGKTSIDEYADRATEIVDRLLTKQAPSAEPLSRRPSSPLWPG